MHASRWCCVRALILLALWLAACVVPPGGGPGEATPSVIESTSPGMPGYPPPRTSTPSPTFTPPGYLPPPTWTPWPTPLPFTPEPTAIPPTPPPSSTPYRTDTPVPAGQMRGTWHQVTMKDGLCTDSPQLVGQCYIGTTDSAAVCYPAAGQFPKPADGTGGWKTEMMPIGTRVVGAGRFPPGGGREIVTDAGVCITTEPEELRCLTPAEGFPYAGVQAMAPLMAAAAYMLDDAIGYDAWSTGTTVSIPATLGDAAARPVTIAGRQMSPDREVWVGTHGYGILVIGTVSHTTWRYGLEDGLPSDTIRDISTGGESCAKICPDLADVWVATGLGVAHWDGATWRTYTVADGLPSDDVYAVSSAQYRTVWAITAAGPAYFDGQAWQAIAPPEGLRAGALRDVAAGRDEVWFSTDWAGLFIYVIERG